MFKEIISQFLELFLEARLQSVKSARFINKMINRTPSLGRGWG